jgi:hypothetical protein
MQAAFSGARIKENQVTKTKLASGDTCAHFSKPRRAMGQPDPSRLLKHNHHQTGTIDPFTTGAAIDVGDAYIRFHNGHHTSARRAGLRL